VNNCSVVLPTIFKNFSGQNQNGYARLQWDIENEQGNISYEIERSDDISSFTKIGTVNGNAGSGGSASYSFNDPSPLKGQTYYRIKMTDGTAAKYSKVVLLSNGQLEFAIRSLINPFGTTLSFDLIAPVTANARVSLIDGYGRVVYRTDLEVNEGINQIRISNLGLLAKGAYLLHIYVGDKLITRNIIKSN
jgi:hypothetical protein